MASVVRDASRKTGFALGKMNTPKKAGSLRKTLTQRGRGKGRFAVLYGACDDDDWLTARARALPAFLFWLLAPAAADRTGRLVVASRICRQRPSITDKRLHCPTAPHRHCQCTGHLCPTAPRRNAARVHHLSCSKLNECRRSLPRGRLQETRPASTRGSSRLAPRHFVPSGRGLRARPTFDRVNL